MTTDNNRAGSVVFVCAAPGCDRRRRVQTSHLDNVVALGNGADWFCTVHAGADQHHHD